jgi:plasmid maintenance system killer protein
MINNAQNLNDLRIPPANRLEKGLGKKYTSVQEMLDDC